MPLFTLIVCISALCALALSLLAVGRIRPELFKIETKVARWFSIKMEIRISKGAWTQQRKQDRN